MSHDRLLACLLAVATGCGGVASTASAASRICTSADTLNFGQRAVGSSTSAEVTVSNCGDQSFRFTDVSVHAATSPAFRVAAACVTDMTLAPAERCTIDVDYAPTAPGQASGAVWLHNTTSTPDQLVTFYGRGVDAEAGTASLAFDPSLVDFGTEVVATETPALTLTLRNTGVAALVPSALVINGADPYDFRGTAGNGPADCGVGRSIDANASCTLKLYFKPRSAGHRVATLVVDAPQLATLAFLTLTGDGAAAPQADAEVDVIEFHDRQDDQYFLTADTREAALLDGGALGPDWSRTGASFRAFAMDAADPRALPVCRFFGTPGVGPESHFYTAYAAECAAVRSDSHWIEEGVTFRAMLPVAGTCAGDTVTVVRFWKPGSTVTETRHRYVVDSAAADAMRAAGWIPEGAVFCAPRA